MSDKVTVVDRSEGDKGPMSAGRTWVAFTDDGNGDRVNVAQLLAYHRVAEANMEQLKCIKHNLKLKKLPRAVEEWLRAELDAITSSYYHAPADEGDFAGHACLVYDRKEKKGN